MSIRIKNERNITGVFSKLENEELKKRGFFLKGNTFTADIEDSAFGIQTYRKHIKYNVSSFQYSLLLGFAFILLSWGYLFLTSSGGELLGIFTILLSLPLVIGFGNHYFKRFTYFNTHSRIDKQVEAYILQPVKGRMFLLRVFSYLFGIYLLGDYGIIPYTELFFSLLLILPDIFKFIHIYSHPWFQFCRYIEKVQSLTLHFEEKSKEIQKSFQEDMNFSVLSDGFDALSKTFSEIITLVIKLEKIEAKANKGNLFDSEKYINSLRLDILIPLEQLKSFLETQKVELEKSQVEIKKIRIRVGMADPSFRSGGQSSGGQEQTELASKRGEPLLQELTENIEKIDGMIQKIA